MKSNVSDHPLTQEEFDEIFSQVPRLTVEVIVRHNGGIVLSKRAIEPGKGTWHIPGGTVRFGESLHAAVDRVAMSELSIKVKNKKQIGWIEYPELLDDGYNGWPVGIAFEVEVKEGEITGSEQGEEVETFTELPENVFYNQAEFLKKFI